MELSCDSLLNRYLVVALQNSVFGSEFLSTCRAVSTDISSSLWSFVPCYLLLFSFWNLFCGMMINGVLEKCKKSFFFHQYSRVQCQ